MWILWIFALLNYIVVIWCPQNDSLFSTYAVCTHCNVFTLKGVSLISILVIVCHVCLCTSEIFIALYIKFVAQTQLRPLSIFILNCFLYRIAFILNSYVNDVKNYFFTAYSRWRHYDWLKSRRHFFDAIHPS